VSSLVPTLFINSVVFILNDIGEYTPYIDCGMWRVEKEKAVSCVIL